MTDCLNAELRDLLPDIVHAQLDAGLRARVEAHVAECTSCRDELALLRSIHLTLQRGGTRVDVTRIVAVLPPPPSRARGATVVPLSSRRRPRWSDWRVAAAATLLIAAGSSVAVLRNRAFTDPALDSGRAVATSAIATRQSGLVAPDAATASVASTVAGAGATSSVAVGAAGDRMTGQAAQRGGGELAVNAALSDLSDSELQTLLGAIDHVQAVPAADPDPNVVTVPTMAPEDGR